MGAIVYENLAAATITYNGVQFGGNDATYKSIPPTYRFRGEFVYDDSGRAIKGVKYQMTVNAVFYETTEATMALAVDAIRERLSAPGKELSITGLGTAFGNITNDIGFGPRPLFFDWQPIGRIAFEVVWVVEFFISECASQFSNSLAFAAFNFDTTWANDFEGMCDRTIAGYVEIAPRRVGVTGKLMVAVADAVRNSINIVVPEHFKRVRNVWRENSAKNRLDFVVTDVAERGTPLPEGCIHADGDFTYASVGPGFAKASCTLNMNMLVSPSFPPAIAGVIFLQAAKTKQDQMQSENDNKAVVIPRHILIRNGKFERSRETTCSITWDLTRCVGSMMKAAGIWDPIPKGPGGDNFSYNLWRASVANLWANRGLHGLQSNVNESAIIDLCDQATGVTIGGTTSEHGPSHQHPAFTFGCPDVPEDGGWIGHDVRVRIFRKDEQSWHKKAIAFLFGSSQINGDDQSDSTTTGGPSYNQTGNALHDVEYHGYPEVYALLQFRGMRLIRKPIMPELKSVGGKEVVQVNHNIDGPRIAYDALSCPVWFIRGWRLYRVNGNVAVVKKVDSKTSCASTDENVSNQYEQ